MFNLLRCEYIKLKRSKITLIGLAGTLIVPLFVVTRAVLRYLSAGTVISLSSLYEDAILFLMLLFGPMVLAVLGAWIIGREYTDGTLKNIFAIPVSPVMFLIGKLLFFALVSLSFMLLSWLEILTLALLCSIFFPVTELSFLSAIFFFIRMFSGGVFLGATQTPLIYLVIRTKGFVAPFIAITAIVLVNVVLSNSPIAGFYPWSAAYFLTERRFSQLNCPKQVSVSIIIVLFLAGIIASLLRFQKEDVK